MKYLVDFGTNTNSEIFESMDKITEWLDDYIQEHLQAHEDFETEKQRFIDNQITEIDED